MGGVCSNLLGGDEFTAQREQEARDKEETEKKAQHKKEQEEEYRQKKKEELEHKAPAETHVLHGKAKHDQEAQLQHRPFNAVGMNIPIEERVHHTPEPTHDPNHPHHHEHAHHHDSKTGDGHHHHHGAHDPSTHSAHGGHHEHHHHEHHKHTPEKGHSSHALVDNKVAPMDAVDPAKAVTFVAAEDN